MYIRAPATPAISFVAMPATMKPTGQMAVRARTFFMFRSMRAGTMATKTVAAAKAYMTSWAASLRTNIWVVRMYRK